ncbi:MAG: hypothetical protein IKV15_09490 [Bacteroidaceae bacterium]|nr:hypothetical protein [Bacteroidaceae bacterium]
MKKKEKPSQPSTLNPQPSPLNPHPAPRQRQPIYKLFSLKKRPFTLRIKSKIAHFIVVFRFSTRSQAKQPTPHLHSTKPKLSYWFYKEISLKETLKSKFSRLFLRHFFVNFKQFIYLCAVFQRTHAKKLLKAQKNKRTIY